MHEVTRCPAAAPKRAGATVLGGVGGARSGAITPRTTPRKPLSAGGQSSREDATGQSSVRVRFTPPTSAAETL